MNEKVVKFLLIVVAIIIPNIGGYIGSKFVRSNLDWFAGLKQPPFNPPKWLFAPAWTILYSVIGVASYLVYDKLRTNGNGFDKMAKTALALFVLQMLFNWIWTYIFFENHSLLWVRN